MPKTVQIRNVPDALHRKLKVRAADSGRTLSDYLLAELERLTARPTRVEMLTRLHKRKSVNPKTPPAVVIRAERDSYSLDELVGRITTRNRHRETDWRDPGPRTRGRSITGGT